MLKYLKFLFRSTNQHGVHSPFVYDYVTRGLYKGKKFKGPVSHRILFRTMAYFEVRSIDISETPDVRLSAALRKYFPDVPVKTTGMSDIIYYNNTLRPGQLAGFLKEKTFGEGQILFLEKIHKDRSSEKAWKEVKRDARVKVTVDLFYAGVVFFRKGQAREDFVIRP